MRRTLVEKCVEEITAVQFMPQERIQERIVEQPADIVVPPIKGEIVDAVQTAMRCRNLRLTSAPKNESGSRGCVLENIAHEAMQRASASEQ